MPLFWSKYPGCSREVDGVLSSTMACDRIPIHIWVHGRAISRVTIQIFEPNVPREGVLAGYGQILWCGCDVIPFAQIITASFNAIMPPYSGSRTSFDGILMLDVLRM